MRPELLELFRNYPQRDATIAGLNTPIVLGPPKTKFKPQEKNKRDTLLKRQNGKCAYCASPFTASLPPTLDHVLPKSRGGGNKISNLVLACGRCNALKGNLASYDEAVDRANLYLAFAQHLKDLGYLR